MYVEQHCLA